MSIKLYNQKLKFI